MPKCKDAFNKKFRLLCSQESRDDINWSSTDSSDYENVSNNKHITYNQKSRKRKRKQKVPNNISNLDIVLEVTNNKDLSRINDREKGSVLLSQYHTPYEFSSTQTSPILCPKTINTKETPKSPILVLKTASPVYSKRVNKKLFSHENDKMNIKRKSPVLHYDSESRNDYILLRKHSTNNKICDEQSLMKNKDNELIKSDNVSDTESIVKETNKNATELDDSLNSLKSNKDWKLSKRVRSYFDNHFSSESASQMSIQDSPTPKNNSGNSSKSSDIDIVSSITQINSNRNSTESYKEESDVILQSKQMRYNKNGLAFRLNALLKKHNANISLWQHERFLAANSNFVIPKEKHLVFVIRNVEIKYGCLLLHTRNIENEPFLILINNEYVNNCIIYKDMILKVFEPYKIVELNTYLKLIINVCKFQGEKINDI